MDTVDQATGSTHQRPIAIPQETEGQISFVFNNLNNQNTLQHAQFIRTSFHNLDPQSPVIRSEAWQWLARYIVIRRVPNEPNHHLMYVNFIDILGEAALDVMVSSESYKLAQTLLRSDRMTEQERLSLKSIGRWFGLFFLGRNRPILADEIDLKSLVIEAFEKGPFHLEYAVPFVTSIFDSHNTVSKPLPMPQFFYLPNPWTQGIFLVLADIFDQPSVPTPIRFDIEILFKHVNMDINAWPRARLIKNDPVKRSILAGKHQMCGTVQHKSLTTIDSINAATMTEQLSDHIGQEDDRHQQSPSNAQSAPSAADLAPLVFNYDFQDFPPTMDEDAKVPFEFPSTLIDRDLAEVASIVLIQTIGNFSSLMVEHCKRSAIPVVDFLLKHDFCFASCEHVIRTVAHNAAAYTTSGIIMSKARDALFTNMTASLSQRFPRTVSNEIINQLVNLNFSLSLCYLSRFSIHRVMQDVERHLSCLYYSLRKNIEPKVAWTLEAMTNSQMLGHSCALVGEAAQRLSEKTRTMYAEVGYQIPGFRRTRGILVETMQYTVNKIADKLNALNCPHLLGILQELNEIDINEPKYGVEDLRSLIEQMVLKLLRQYRREMTEFRDGASTFFASVVEFTVMGQRWVCDVVSDFYEQQCLNEGFSVRFNFDALCLLVHLNVIKVDMLDSIFDTVLSSPENDQKRADFLENLHHFVTHCLIYHAGLVTLGDLTLTVQHVYSYCVINFNYREKTCELVMR
ncbi:hypothetical protein ACOME3_000444 [Neoechinorhynchus agilis]